MHLKVKDTVVVLVGKAKNSRGRVLSVDAAKGRAIVEGVNIVKRHSRANPQKGIQGGIMEREAPIHVSNLKVVCPRCGKPTRPRMDVTAKGRVRSCRRQGCGAPLA